MFIRAERGVVAWDCYAATSLGNADPVVGDQIEQEVGGDATDAAMFGLTHGTMLLASTEDALHHRAV